MLVHCCDEYRFEVGIYNMIQGLTTIILTSTRCKIRTECFSKAVMLSDCGGILEFYELLRPVSNLGIDTRVARRFRAIVRTTLSLLPF